MRLRLLVISVMYVLTSACGRYHAKEPGVPYRRVPPLARPLLIAHSNSAGHTAIDLEGGETWPLVRGTCVGGGVSSFANGLVWIDSSLSSLSLATAKPERLMIGSGHGAPHLSRASCALSPNGEILAFQVMDGREAAVRSASVWTLCPSKGLSSIRRLPLRTVPHKLKWVSNDKLIALIPAIDGGPADLATVALDGTAKLVARGVAQFDVYRHSGTPLLLYRSKDDIESGVVNILRGQQRSALHIGPNIEQCLWLSSERVVWLESPRRGKGESNLYQLAVYDLAAEEVTWRSERNDYMGGLDSIVVVAPGTQGGADRPALLLRGSMRESLAQLLHIELVRRSGEPLTERHFGQLHTTQRKH